MPPMISNCQFFFRNFKIFPKAICQQQKTPYNIRMHGKLVKEPVERKDYLAWIVKRRVGSLAYIRRPIELWKFAEHMGGMQKSSSTAIYKKMLDVGRSIWLSTWMSHIVMQVPCHSKFTSVFQNVADQMPHVLPCIAAPIPIKKPAGFMRYNDHCIILLNLNEKIFILLKKHTENCVIWKHYATRI